MTKEVLVSIRGIHAVDGESDNVEVITAGSYYFKNNKHYIVYDELVEGFDRAVKNTIRIGRNTVDVMKSGPARSHMVFEENKTNVNCYSTAFGQMMVGVSTNMIDIDEQEDRISVHVDYTLDVNFEKMSNCRISIDIQSKEKADFHLNS